MLRQGRQAWEKTWPAGACTPPAMDHAVGPQQSALGGCKGYVSRRQQEAQGCWGVGLVKGAEGGCLWANSRLHCKLQRLLIDMNHLTKPWFIFNSLQVSVTPVCMEDEDKNEHACIVSTRAELSENLQKTIDATCRCSISAAPGYKTRQCSWSASSSTNYIAPQFSKLL